MKKMIITAMATLMLFGTSLTANAQVLLPDHMTESDDGRIKITDVGGYALFTDKDGHEWQDPYFGYPFCTLDEEYTIEKLGQTFVGYREYLDWYLTDYIKSHDSSEWPNFVIKGSDGTPFYLSINSQNNNNYDKIGAYPYGYYVKYGYDEASGWWIEDKSYKGPYAKELCTGMEVEPMTRDEAVVYVKELIANGTVINGTPNKPITAKNKDKITYTKDDDRNTSKDKDKDTTDPVDPSEDEPTVNPSNPEDITDPYADINTLNAVVTVKTDCIKVKKNNKAQKPMPKSVKVNGKALKKNKTFTVSYEKYENGWYAVDAVTDEGLYRMVVTGKNGYDGICTKKLYVTSDKTIKAMSSVAVKVNKVNYTGEPIVSGVIKSAKAGKRVLTENVDYTVSYTNNVDSGTAQVTLKAVDGSGLLGTKTVNFTIGGNKMSKVKVAGIEKLTYTGEAVEQSNVTLTFNGITLEEGKDYDVSYTNNIKVGTAKITFTGKGLYNGKLTKSFKIVKAPVVKNDDTKVNTMNVKSVEAESVAEETAVEESKVVEESVVAEESVIEEESAVEEESETVEEPVAEDEESVTEEVAEEESDVNDEEAVEEEESVVEETIEEEESVNEEESIIEEESIEEESAEDEEAEADAETVNEESEAEEAVEAEDDDEAVIEEAEDSEAVEVVEESAEDEESEAESLTDEELEELSEYTGISIEELIEMDYEDLQAMMEEMENAEEAEEVAEIVEEEIVEDTVEEAVETVEIEAVDAE